MKSNCKRFIRGSTKLTKVRVRGLTQIKNGKTFATEDKELKEKSKKDLATHLRTRLRCGRQDFTDFALINTDLKNLGST